MCTQLNFESVQDSNDTKLGQKYEIVIRHKKSYGKGDILYCCKRDKGIEGGG